MAYKRGAKNDITSIKLTGLFSQIGSLYKRLMAPLKYQIPHLYQAFIPSPILDLPIQEILATCDRCVQVPRYKENLKCCTFEPFLPNFLVGEIIKAEQGSPSFISSVLQHKISTFKEAIPLGVLPSLDFRLEFKKLGKGEEFGNRESWLCPYFNGVSSSCGIWRSRGSVCTSFFCISSKGEMGQKFWTKLGDYFHLIEMGLAQRALVEMGFGPRSMQAQLSYLEAENKAAAHEFWKDSAYEPLAFYLKCLEFVKNFDRPSLLELLGPEVLYIEAEINNLGKIWQ